MFLHIGAEVLVWSDDLIGIFDYRLAELGTILEFIDYSKWNSEVIALAGKPKSVVVCPGRIYLTPVSPATLGRRWAAGD